LPAARKASCYWRQGRRRNAYLRLVDSRSAPRSSSSTTLILRLAERAALAAAAGFRPRFSRPPVLQAGPESGCFVFDIWILLSAIQCPKEIVGRGTNYTDEQLVAEIRRTIQVSPFHGEGHRKVWARLRHCDVRTSLRRVLRLMRQHQLLAAAAATAARRAQAARRNDSAGAKETLARRSTSLSFPVARS